MSFDWIRQAVTSGGSFSRSIQNLYLEEFLAVRDELRKLGIIRMTFKSQ